MIIHMCPPKGSNIMPCCNIPPGERKQDQLTQVPGNVTCGSGMVAIAKDEYERLKRRSKWLAYLSSQGVRNWQGWDYAAETARRDGNEDAIRY